MVVTEPAVASVWLLGLGSKLSPSNMPRMLNKDLTRFVQSLSRVRQNRASERKALLTGWFHGGSMIGCAPDQQSRSRYTSTSYHICIQCICCGSVLSMDWPTSDVLKFKHDSETLGTKFSNFSRLHCFSIPRRDLSRKETKPNTVPS